MQSLPDALAPLAAYRQFIAYKLVPNPDGRTIKKPVDPATGRVHDAHDRSIWTDFESVAASGHPVGFVFCDDDPFFFIDIDDCALPPKFATWSPLALELISRFPGAAVEVSQSGTGLHIIGTGDAPTDRKIKGDGFDLYTDGRFIALTGNGAIGSVLSDHTPALAQLVKDYLTMDVGKPTKLEWTEGPCAEWSGPEDDDELLRRAMSGRSSAAAFGSRASFRNLWEADEDALAAAFPDDHKVRPYDASKADSALAQHLAFWTGKDCERIKTLMERSGLKRDKWDDRADYYLPRTILKACAQQKAVASSKAASKPPETHTNFVVPSMMDEIFDRCVYVVNQHRAYVPGGRLLEPKQFRVIYGGRKYVIDPEGKSTTNAWDAFTESELWRPTVTDTTCFRPELEPGSIVSDGSETAVNVWEPVNTHREPGDASRWVELVQKLLPVDQDFQTYMAYLAACVQYPGVKFRWAPLLQSAQGAGKGAISEALSWAIGQRYVHLQKASDLGNKFNAWIQHKLLVVVDEIKAGDRREIMDSLLDLVTNKRVAVQGKGADQDTSDNRANFLFFSNNKDAILIDKNDRRYAVFYAAQQEAADLARDGMDGNYFPDLYAWLNGEGKYADRTPGYAHVAHLLQEWPIPDALNPATSMHRAPETSSTASALVHSLGSIEQEIREQIAQDRQGFAGGWVSGTMLERFLDHIKATRQLPPNKRPEALRRLGYVPHPHLPNGRAVNRVQPDGSKSLLYVREGHLASSVTDTATIERLYTEAQNRDVFVDAAQRR
ncbi:DUF5906 domain-containing protein [Marinobacter sp.]|uniref:phage NrS-1 polymerase family protein n=1 Tax=Marinobacter sp. TaxID=50741 RepID=UPI000C8F6EE4|nr:DUF5906 domain-containing protein [Marinobacter sp.]MAB53451.1 hypothetical protein [Marinobacter sp.]